jgi:hypothetical protein
MVDAILWVGQTTAGSEGTAHRANGPQDARHAEMGPDDARRAPMEGTTDDTLDVPPASTRRTTQPALFVESARSGTGCTGKSATCHAVEPATHPRARGTPHGRRLADPDRRTVQPIRAASIG